MKLKSKTIITDLDGVIRHFPMERDNEIESRYKLPLGTIARIVFEPTRLNSVITGKISDQI